MHKSTTLLILLIALISACARKAIVPLATDGSTQRAVTSSEETTTPKHTNIWTFSPTNNTRQYHSISKIRLQLDDPSGPDNQDAFSVVTEFSARIDQLHTPVIVTGSVENVLTTSGLRISIDPEKITLPINFNGTITGGKLTLDITPPSVTSFNSDLCSTPARAILGDIRTAIVTLPLPLQLHSTWADTITTTTCTGRNISSDLRIIRSYVVIGEINYAGTSFILIKRAEITHINGAGIQGQHNIIIAGEGSGSSNLYLNPRTGLVIIIEALHNSRITTNTSGHLQHFSQSLTQKVTVRP